MKEFKKVDESLFKTASCVHKYPKIILSYKDVPYESCLVFNAAAIKENDTYIMIFRNDLGDYENKKLNRGVTNLGLATSKDGYNWVVDEKPLWEFSNDEILRVYDPRLTKIEGVYYLCFAVDTAHGLRGGIARSYDLKKFDIIYMSTPDNRNMVLFPEKINGMYYRLERPMPVYSFGYDKFDIWISQSSDLEFWGKSQLLIGVEDVPFANDKIGPAAPPIKTDKGWLTIFHSVDYNEERGKNGWEPVWKKRYVAGVMLLDLNDPTKVLGLYDKPLIVPDTEDELYEGFRANVVFPCALIKEDDNTVKIYYGASDTFVRVATANIDDLINLCLEKKFEKKVLTSKEVYNIK